MARVVAYEDVKENRVRRDVAGGKHAWRTRFMLSPEDQPHLPHAHLGEGSPGRLLRTHYHEVDQFQVIVQGKGSLGTHPLAVGGVHFSRAYTPYGPIRFGEEEGMSFVTLRAHRDKGGARHLPEKREELQSIPDRKPWQLTTMPDFESLRKDSKPMAISAIPEMQDGKGLAGYGVVMKPGARGLAPSAANTEGQHIVILKGGLMSGGQVKQALTVIWVEPDEPAFELVAGPEGLEAVVLNYPRTALGRSAYKPERSDAGLKVWQCELCAFVYDEAEGMPSEGIAPGTRWADVPETFGCPDCEARKADFQMVEI